MQILILFFLLLLLLLFKNAINQAEAGKIKQEKSFGEIFGQRWDEGTEENICRIDQIFHGEIADQNQNIQQFDQIFDEDLEVKKEESEEMSINCDQLEQFPKNVGQICDHLIVLENKKKREIVQKFHKIKEKIKKKGKKFTRKEWTKIERKIAQKLGTKQKNLYKWKREFGVNIRNSYSEEEKHKILMQFDQIYGKLKMKFNEKLERKGTKCQKIIAKHLGINIRSIQKWKKQLKNGTLEKNQKINDEKKEIVEKYFKIKKEFMQNGKHSQKEWREFRAKIQQMFGVNFITIERWAKKSGINQSVSKDRKVFTFAEKSEKMKQYYQMKKQNSNLKEYEIASELGIPMSSLYKYKSKLMGEAKKF